MRGVFVLSSHATAEAPLSKRIPFSMILRRSIAEAHDRADPHRFMNALLDSGRSLSGYAQLIAQYHFIYAVLEQASDAMADHPVAGKFVFDELRRNNAIEADLQFLVGPDWRNAIEPLPATVSYVNRIRSVAFDWAGGFVAHHYTRYLGDLAGGLLMRRLLERNYALYGPGTLFYRFEDLGCTVAAFRGHYRSLLDTVPWDDVERARVVDESLVGFDCTVGVFTEVTKGMLSSPHASAVAGSPSETMS